MKKLILFAYAASIVGAAAMISSSDAEAKTSGWRAQAWENAAIGAVAEADQPAVIVSFDDLDLTDVDDVAVLHERIRDAAEQVCSEHNSPRVSTYHMLARKRACIRSTTHSAMSDVDGLATGAVTAHPTVFSGLGSLVSRVFN